jgi:hypothetical protein
MRTRSPIQGPLLEVLGVVMPPFHIAAGIADGTLTVIDTKDLNDALRTIRELRAAISGWRDHYGWKDGEYIDNVNEIFEPLGGKPDNS